MMKWDYTAFADAYLKRPDYSPEVIDAALEVVGIDRPRAAGARVADIGAGAAHLTRPLAERGFTISAVEPNAAMRTHGERRTRGFARVLWSDGTGEASGLNAASYDLVTFGSSFGMTDRARALEETARIAKPHGWLMCLWNFREFGDSLQSRVRAAIAQQVDGFETDAGRYDPSDVIDASGLFSAVRVVEARIVHHQTVADFVDAWRSQAKFRQQAGVAFDAAIARIESVVNGLERVRVPYTTRAWLAQRRD